MLSGLWQSGHFLSWMTSKQLKWNAILSGYAIEVCDKNDEGFRLFPSVVITLESKVMSVNLTETKY